MTVDIPFLRPSVPKLSAYQQHIEAMQESGLYSNYGPLNQEFERRVLKRFFNNEGAVLTTNNATLALALAVRGCARPDGRYVIMPSFTFAATPLATVWAGFEPYYVDVDPASWMMTSEALNEALELLGDDVAAVMPYATFGANMDLEPFAELVKQGIPVIVDAAASLGSGMGEQNFGYGFPGVVAYSMHATKPFSVGEGGLLYSANESTIARLRANGNFGFGADRAAQEIGFNTKLPEILAAVALATLDEFEEKLAARTEVYEAYRASLKKHGLEQVWPVQASDGRRAHQFFACLIPEGLERSEVLAKLESHGIQARTYFSPACHEQAALSGYRAGSLTTTELLSQRVLSLPLWEGLSEAQIEKIVNVLAECAS